MSESVRYRNCCHCLVGVERPAESSATGTGDRKAALWLIEVQTGKIEKQLVWLRWIDREWGCHTVLYFCHDWSLLSWKLIYCWKAKALWIQKWRPSISNLDVFLNIGKKLCVCLVYLYRTWELFMWFGSCVPLLYWIHPHMVPFPMYPYYCTLTAARVKVYGIIILLMIVPRHNTMMDQYLKGKVFLSVDNVGYASWLSLLNCEKPNIEHNNIMIHHFLHYKPSCKASCHIAFYVVVFFSKSPI